MSQASQPAQIRSLEVSAPNVSRRVLAYIAVAALLIVGYYLLRGFDWQGSSELHTLMETVASILALFVGILALARFYSKKSSIFLFVGAGFLGTASLDGYHAVVTSSLFADLWPSAPSHLIPWSWIASRLFLGVLMFFSLWAWQREERLGEAGRIDERLVYGAIVALAAASFAFFAFYPLPRAYYPEVTFHRPEEFVPALFFGLALVGYLRKGGWKYDAFEHWLVLSLIVGFLGQTMFMSLSGQLFDYEFDAAHLLKKVSYLLVLVGLLVSMYHLFRQAEDGKAALAKANEELRHLAHHDPLTGLANRTLLQDRSDVALAQAKRGGYDVAVITMDLDNFKTINDTLGHKAGDEVLRLAASRLYRLMRDGDTIARTGGDEFVALVTRCSSKADGLRVTERLIKAFREPLRGESSHYRVTISAGVSFFPADGDDLETLVHSADSALYGAKRNGRDQFQVHSSSIASPAKTPLS